MGKWTSRLAHRVLGGGSDLVFPHHENEIAQSEAATGSTFARIWMHNGMIRVDQEKMSKSLGNFSTIHELLGVHDAETIRAFLLGQHYRSPVDFSMMALEESRRALARAYSTLARVDRGDWGRRPGGAGRAGADATAASSDWLEVERTFQAAMDDDFNTARAIGVLFEAVRSINRLADVSSEADSGGCVRAREGRELVAKLGGQVLGVLQGDAQAWLERDRDRRSAQMGLDVTWVEEQLLARAQARSERRWADADAIRSTLARRGVVLEDRPGATTVWGIADAEPDAPTKDA